MFVLKLDTKISLFPLACLFFARFVSCPLSFLGEKHKKTPPLFFCDSPPMIRVFWCSGTRLGARACDSLFFCFLSFFPERGGLFLVLARLSSLEGHSRLVPSTSHGSVTFTEGAESAPAPRAFLCSVSVCLFHPFWQPQDCVLQESAPGFPQSWRRNGEPDEHQGWARAPA